MKATIKIFGRVIVCFILGGVLSKIINIFSASKPYTDSYFFAVIIYIIWNFAPDLINSIKSLRKKETSTHESLDSDILED